jgi:hypothetical protein
MFSPAYDNPQKLSTVAGWFKEMGMEDIRAGLIEYKKGFTAATVKGIKRGS